MDSLPTVAVIIVNYRGKADTLECLSSLTNLTYPNVRVYVVDQPFGDGDRERDGTPEAIRERFSGVIVLENPVNNGFAGGNNGGIRHAFQDGADYVFLLNNDTTVEPDLLEPLVSLAESDERIGIVGPLMLYYDQPEIVWAAGGAINERAESVLIGEGKRPDELPSTPEERDFIVGCGLLAKRTVLEKIGLFDERYFLYYEESDLCARARRDGWRVMHQPMARLYHKVSRTTGTESELTLYYMRRNALLFLRRNAPRPEWHVPQALLDSLRLSLVWLAQGKTRRCRVLLRAVTDYLRGRFGRTDFVFQK